MNNELPNLYSCATMNIEEKMLLVNQVTKGIPHLKLTGGTFMGPKKHWVKKNEQENYYNILSSVAVKSKLLVSLERAFGKFANNTAKKIFPLIVEWVLEFTGDNPALIHLAVEWIEEIGIVPLEAKFLCKIPKGNHIKRAFEVTKALTFKSEDQDFRYVKTGSDLPLRGQDFECVDEEVKDTVLVTRKEAEDSNFGWGIHQEARDVLFLTWEKDRVIKDKYEIK